MAPDSSLPGWGEIKVYVSHTHWEACNNNDDNVFKRKMSVGEDVEKLEPLYTADGPVKWWQTI